MQLQIADKEWQAAARALTYPSDPPVVMFVDKVLPHRSVGKVIVRNDELLILIKPVAGRDDVHTLIHECWHCAHGELEYFDADDRLVRVPSLNGKLINEDAIDAWAMAVLARAERIAHDRAPHLWPLSDSIRVQLTLQALPVAARVVEAEEKRARRR